MKISVDIVLLPPPEIMNLCFEFNKEIIARGGDITIFDRETCIPHISMLMGVVEEEDLPSIVADLQSLAHDTKPLSLSIEELLLTQIPNWYNNYSFTLSKLESLRELHHEIFSKLLNKFSFDPTLETIYPDPLPEEITLWRIRKFAERSDFTKFSPHITLGVGGDAELSFVWKREFITSQIGIYHLGNYCTCAKELSRIDLWK